MLRNFFIGHCTKNLNISNTDFVTLTTILKCNQGLIFDSQRFHWESVHSNIRLCEQLLFKTGSNFVNRLKFQICLVCKIVTKGVGMTRQSSCLNMRTFNDKLFTRYDRWAFFVWKNSMPTHENNRFRPYR